MILILKMVNLKSLRFLKKFLKMKIGQTLKHVLFVSQEPFEIFKKIRTDLGCVVCTVG